MHKYCIYIMSAPPSQLLLPLSTPPLPTPPNSLFNHAHKHTEVTEPPYYCSCVDTLRADHLGLNNLSGFFPRENDSSPFVSHRLSIVLHLGVGPCESPHSCCQVGWCHHTMLVQALRCDFENRESLSQLEDAVLKQLLWFSGVYNPFSPLFPSVS